MPDATPQPDQSLHLPSLVIKNFRGIDELTIPRLGRVTLLAGKNGVGKTTVLDAVRVWAACGASEILEVILKDRGDAFSFRDNDQERVVVDRVALFTNRQDFPQAVISIGPTETDRMLHIQPDIASETRGLTTFPPLDMLDKIRLKIMRGNGRSWMEGSGIFSDPSYPTVICNTLGPNAPSNGTIEHYWSEVALTAHEDMALDALNLITTAEVERVAALGPPTNNGIIQPRRVMAKVKGTDYQVPLRSLGDGAMRTYAVALALAKCSGGFLLIDEAENGIHHTIQPKFWKMVLQTAQRNNVQVIATTHSWDCVKGFAEASSELEDVEGTLVRLERHEDRLRAVEYTERNLKAAAKYGIEVR
jgi:predicted ATPase